MQLFVSDYIHIDKTISIYDNDVLSQLRTVLRYRVGDVFYIQKPVYISDLIDGNMKIIRYQLKITNWDKDKLDGTITWQENLAIVYDKKTVIVSMTNKREKLELICQKLTEIGIQNIIIFPSKRSVIKQPNNNKITRINKIIKESVEQSYGVVLPTLSRKQDLDLWPDDLVLYQWWSQLDITSIPNFNNIWSIVIWPEWWWDKIELDLFKDHWCQFISIWKTILRAETAAILWWWILKNLL